MKKLLTAALGVAMLGVTMTPALASAEHVTICHRTGSASNPYVQISPSAAGVYNGHLAHEQVGNGLGGDIIPPFEWQGQTYSKNWNAAGRAIWNNGCNVPVTPPPPPPPPCGPITFNCPPPPCEITDQGCPPPELVRYRVFTTMPKYQTHVRWVADAHIRIVRHCHAFVVKLTSGAAQTAVRVFSKPRTFLRVKSEGKLLDSAIGKRQGC